MDLSNLRPADGSKHSDNFRRGRGHGSGNGKTDVFLREVSLAETLRKSLESMSVLLKYLTTMQ